MFSPGSLDKSTSALSENSSPVRSNFAVAINPLGDESQQNIRIQLAVHRYNNSTNSSFIRPINERSVPSPFKHAFLKNSLKYKSFENHKEEPQNTLKKSHNLYQGVGNFPVVHLKKNAVVTKPVKKATSSDFKIQLPELPFNRFLNHSPDVCLDTKTSTRSVLDVLQDLSRKRIHTKDDNETSKRKCKGLGGDAPLDIEAPYKPLFVSKSKSIPVTLRDSTTQTQDLPSFDTSQSKKNEAVINSEKDDPKAELRKKLARQNNEIFASLSSSTLPYPLKRHADKITQGKDDSKERKAKKARYLVEDTNDKHMQNGNLSSKDILAAGSMTDQSNKIEKKQKAVDSNKATSPNKDRLTAIFLEMQNINPKVEVLTKNKEASESETDAPARTIGSPADKTVDVKKTAADSKDLPSEKSTETSNASEAPKPVPVVVTTAVADSPKVSASSDEKAKNEVNMFSPPKENVAESSKEASVSEKTSTTTSTVMTTPSFMLPTSATINFGVPSTSPGFKLPLASTVSSSLTQTPIFSTGLSQKGNSFSLNTSVSSPQESSKNETNTSNQGLSFLVPGKVQVSTGSSPGMFTFGVNASNAPAEQKTVTTSSEAVTTSANPPVVSSTPTVANSMLGGFSQSMTGTSVTTMGTSPAFAISTAATLTTTTSTTTFTQSQPSLFTFSDKTATAGSDKPQTFPFTFGQAPTSTAGQPPMFGLGNNLAQKAEEKPENKEVANQDSSKANSTTGTFAQSTFPSNAFSVAAPTFGQTSTTQPTMMPFKFGEKNDTPASKPSTEPTTTASMFEQKPATGMFTFGQKSSDPVTTSATQPAASQPNMFQSGVFSFGQKPPAPASNPQPVEGSSVFGQSAPAQSNLFQQSVTSQPTTTASTMINSTSPFGIASQASDQNQNKSAIPSFLQPTSTAAPTGMNNTFTQNKLSMPAFGQSTPTFGQTATSNFTSGTNVFGASTTQSTPTFGASTTQSTPTFGASTSQTTPAFGANTSQTAPTFGANTTGQSSPFNQPFGDSTAKQNTNFFMQPPNAPTTGFGQTPAFGSATFGQSAPTENNIFGQKTFDQNQNQNVQGTPFGQTQSQPFGAQAPFTFGAPTTTAASTGFAMNPSTTTASVFTFGTATKTTPASSSNFSFSGGSQPSTSTQPSPFTFNSQPGGAFKFGASPKETPPFGGGSGSGAGARPFGFESTPATTEAAKPAAPVFNFGGAQPPSSSGGFNFGGTPSPVFSFGGSGSSTTSSSKFSFGSTPSGSGMFTPGATPSPLQGVFSIGTGSNQPRSRSSTTRARRRT